MQLGMIGLGKMGANMALRLHRDGHQVIGFDPVSQARERSRAQGVAVEEQLEAVVQQLSAPRYVWLMVPATVVDATLAQLLPLLSEGDCVIDGGNAWYRDSMRRSRLAAEHHGVAYVDCGTSGGVWGLENGYSLMVGGDPDVVAGLAPVLRSLAPAPEEGWAHVGPVGAGHYCKMIHNGIEYGMMQAYAEGFALLHGKKAFALDLPQVARVWQRGSVIRSWLLDLSAEALRENPGLEGIAPFVEDSGEGRWTVAEAIDLDVPAPVITLALLERLRSRQDNSYSDRLLAAMRTGFGGHALPTAANDGE